MLLCKAMVWSLEVPAIQGCKYTSSIVKAVGTRHAVLYLESPLYEVGMPPTTIVALRATVEKYLRGGTVMYILWDLVYCCQAK